MKRPGWIRIIRWIAATSDEHGFGRIPTRLAHEAAMTFDLRLSAHDPSRVINRTSRGKPFEEIGG